LSEPATTILLDEILECQTLINEADPALEDPASIAFIKYWQRDYLIKYQRRLEKAQGPLSEGEDEEDDM